MIFSIAELRVSVWTVGLMMLGLGLHSYLLDAHAESQSPVTAELPEKSNHSHSILEPRFAEAKLGVDEVAYRATGNQDGTGVIFIHGTPGDGTAFSHYLLSPILQRDFFLVAVDRLGWGESSLVDDQLAGNFERQAQAIIAVMNEFPHQQWILVGHSLGASIAPKVAILAPHKVVSLMLLAGSLNPELGKPRWFNRVAHTWLVSQLIGRNMRRSNREIMNLNAQLIELNEQITTRSLAQKVVVIQGMKDRLVSPKNVQFAQQVWRNHFSELDTIELDNEGHFLPWRQTELIIETLQGLRSRFLQVPRQDSFCEQ